MEIYENPQLMWIKKKNFLKICTTYSVFRKPQELKRKIELWNNKINRQKKTGNEEGLWREETNCVFTEKQKCPREW